MPQFSLSCHQLLPWGSPFIHWWGGYILIWGHHQGDQLCNCNTSSHLSVGSLLVGSLLLCPDLGCWWTCSLKYVTMSWLNSSTKAFWRTLVQCHSKYSQDQARADIAARGFWDRHRRTFFDVRIFDSFARSYLNSSLSSCHKSKDLACMQQKLTILTVHSSVTWCSCSVIQWWVFYNSNLPYLLSTYSTWSQLPSSNIHSCGHICCTYKDLAGLQVLRLLYQELLSYPFSQNQTTWYLFLIFYL